MKLLTVVDDEPSSLDVMVRAATSWRFACQSARCAEQAITLLEGNPTPVIVTDLRMPGRGGVWLVKEIQKRWPDSSIIVVTAWGDSDAVAECLDCGTHHIFLKPINLDEFRHSLEANLRTFYRKRELSRLCRFLQETVASKTRQVRRTFLSAIESLVRTLEARDPYTSGHSLRVCHFALNLLDEIGCDVKTRKQVEIAAKLHDLGKLGIPDSILNKAGPLTDEEVVAIREHPVLGERILAPVIRSKAILGAIRWHHERFDGAGYPDGLAGNKIPLAARVITIADCYDALTSSRAYRDALPASTALAMIADGAGSQFDPELVPHFLAALGNVCR